MSKRNNFFGSKTSLTARTIAFLAATGITDTTIANALNTMDLALIANGLDVRLYALYPFVGGTATTHKFNFMNPADTDAAFRLAFSGGGTHGANGWQTGVNAYANTFFNDQTQAVTQGDYGFGCYSRTNTTGYKVDMGIGSATPTYSWIVSRFDATTTFAGVFDDSNFNGNYITDSRGYLSTQRVAGVEHIYRNSTQLATRSFAARGYGNLNIFLAARNLLGAASNYSDREYCYFDIRKSMDATQMTNYYTIIQNLQTALSRNV